MTNKCPILTIDLTADDDEFGVESWSESGYLTGNSAAHHSAIAHDDEIAGPSTAMPMNSTMIEDNFEWETEEYMKLLQKMQDDFNKEIEEGENQEEAVLVQNMSMSEIIESNLFPPTPTVSTPVAEVEVHTSTNTTNDGNNNNTMQALKKFPVVQMLDAAPAYHKYFTSPFTPVKKNFLAVINKDRKLLENDLPPGIYVKTFENRLDLLSVLIEGPADTPYDGCLFMFDIQVSNEHPLKPPKVHYWAFCGNRLNPNLYTHGMVCVSLLGTWRGNSVEKWSSKSTILQVLVSIQGLILVPEPFYNEPGTVKPLQSHAAKLYNGRTLHLVLESMANHMKKPPEMFSEEVVEFYRETLGKTLERLKSYIIDEKTAPFPLNLLMHRAQIKAYMSVLTSQAASYVKQNPSNV